MTTASLAKIKCPEALSWHTLAKICRLCLRNECIKFDIFEEADDRHEADSLSQRIKRFYEVTVVHSDRLPTKICHDCLLHMEVHTEFRQCVLQNEQRLRDFAVELFPKDDVEPAAPQVAPVNGVIEAEESNNNYNSDDSPVAFTQQELQTATVVDPNQVYVSESSEEDDESGDEDEDEEEQGDTEKADQANDAECDDDSGELGKENPAILLLSDEEEDDDDDEEEGEITNNSYLNSSHRLTSSGLKGVPHPTGGTSILEQHLLQGMSTMNHTNNNNNSTGTNSHHPHPHQPSNNHHLTDEQKTFFLCQFCDLGFKFQTNCQDHEQTKHDALQPYNCIFCLFCSDQRPLLQQHLRDIHGFPKPFICTECKKGFTRRSDLRKHTIVHTGVRPYTCGVCSKSFSRNTNLTKHIRIHSGHKPFVCPKCPKTFVTGSDMERHQRTHDGIKPYQCSVCPSSFARRDKLINHQNMHVRRGDLNFNNANVMDIGGVAGGLNSLTVGPQAGISQQPQQQQVLQQPQSQLTGDSDRSGDAGMVIDLDPLTEMRSANGMDMSQRILEAALMRGSLAPNHFGSLMNLPEQLFASQSSDPQSQVDDDITMVPEEMAAAIPLSPLPPPMEAILPPTIINHPLPSSQLPSQSQPIVTIDLQRPFVCTICGKGFPRKQELDRHESVHTGVKPFVCDQCPKSFSRKDKLVRHKRTHVGVNDGEGVGQGGGEGGGLVVNRLQGGVENAFPSTQQQQPAPPPQLPQMSFTAALENFRRTEMMSSRMDVGMGRLMEGRDRQGPGGSSGMVRDVDNRGGLRGMLMEPKDFSFKPNFYSQISIGGSGSSSNNNERELGQRDELMENRAGGSKPRVKEEF